MARALRIQFPHAIYHVMARDNRGGMIFGEPKELPKSDQRKMLLAAWLKRHFSVTNGWISERLWMGHRSTVTRAMKSYEKPPRNRQLEVAALRRILTFLTPLYHQGTASGVDNGFSH